MTIHDVLKQQFAGGHDILEQTIADCAPETLHKTQPGATITSIASIYAHIVFTEDMIIQGMLQQKPPVYQSQGWAGRASVAMPSTPGLTVEWAHAVRMNLASFREYAKAVYAATDAYAAALSDGALDRKVDTGFVGEQTVAFILGNICVWHVSEHGGEIAALKGVQGLKGLPF
jgi:hypothetical protein